MKKFRNEYLNQALSELRFKELTAVQNKVIELFDKDNDLVIEAKTGSGKTHAFLLPILDSLDLESKDIHACIIAPTRELAIQINRFAQDLVKHSKTPISINLYLGGEDKEREIEWLKNKQPQIVIGTPGRLHDLVIKENVLKIYKTKYFVIDEADMTLDHDFLETVDNLAATVSEAKFMVFSATIPERLKPFLRKYINKPIMVEVHPEEISNLNIKHYFIKTKEQDRFIFLKKIVDVINPYMGIIFCNTKESCDSVYNWMKDRFENVTVFHGDIDFRKRKQIIKRINNLEFQYIVATDILARGIDIVGVSHIINFELPRDFEFYIHRSGRTGRIDFDGVCLSMYEFNDNSYLDKLENKGVKCEYKAIRNGMIVDASIRKSREKRVRPENELDYEAKRKVKKPKKIKPAYKKKYQEAVNKEKKKLARKKR
ncbi:MAG: DEAD/DEAH box helicase [Candidatus Izemoplasmatales bacterium]|jgi:ATP-dependent RNA helicase CshB|nr:DEAD/DEAH box helicase [Candidatus Izemoplasmatales bacterium]